ncbi:9612_t:CDS:2 [Cetraspora pellucida]|uniref:9612_t:CDS:1 n=1 Tax=Cetraspora pellucida TaxID=1433469 RepID=A0ACA9MXU4_9GLOM|nr:9612_t:CDS:2 [Cetraspora pellucida]
MSLTNLQNFVLNILKETKHNAIQNIEVTEILLCLECDKNIIINSYELFTILTYYDKVIKPMIFEQKFSELSQSTTSSIETPINSSNLSSKKQTSDSTEKSTSKKIKPVNKDSLLTLKKLIKELTTSISMQILSENTIILQSGISEMNINSVNFHKLNEKIIKTEDNNQKNKLKHNMQSNNEDASNALVNDKIRKHIPNQDKITETNLQKRKERTKKVFRLFNSIGGENMIDRIKSFFASNISNLSLDDIDYIIAKILKGSSDKKEITAPL